MHRSLGVYVVSSKSLKCSLNNSKRSFYHSFNAIFGKVGRLAAELVTVELLTRGQSNLTKSASQGAHSPVRGHPRGSKFVPLNSWGRGSY